jgi:F-type H+-transporting ATPase subunit c
MITPDVAHYLIAGCLILLGAGGAGIGLGLAAVGVEDASTRQQTGQLQSFNAMIIGLALIESGAIIALVMTLMTLFNRPVAFTWPIIWAEAGTAVAIGTAAIAISIASSFVVKAASQAIARQPLYASKITTYMLIAQSIIEAPVIFAFIVALLIRTRIDMAMDLWAGMRLFACGLAVGIGALGPSIGQAMFARSASYAIGINVHQYNKIFPYALLTQALIETPMIFCLLFSLLFLYVTPTAAMAAVATIKGLVAAGTISFGALGGCIGMGYMASHTSAYVALDPTVYSAMVRTALFTMAFIESTVIYSFIISLILIIK